MESKDLLTMRAALRQALVIAVVALVPALLAGLLHPKLPAWNPAALKADEVLAAEVALWAKAPLWVDARTRGEFEKEHIPEAVLLNEDEWDELLPGVLTEWDPGQRIVVYCDSDACDSSHAVATRLREAGLSPVSVLHGGWKAWKEAQR